MLRIAIVGLGPWGVCALERIVTTARRGLRAGLEVEIHVIEPGTPGSGVYDPTQPDYLLLNSTCAAIALHPFADQADLPSYCISLYDWADAQGYRWVGDFCSLDPSGRRIEPGDYLPRRLMGEYLYWFYRALVAAAPPSVRVIHHPTSAIDLVALVEGHEEVHLANGSVLLVDHVVVTSGHTANEETGEEGSYPRQLNPYPVTKYVQTLPAGSTVAVSGMGLVAMDVVTALSLGRGGRFTDQGQGLRYQPSGQEPVIQVFSRGGLPSTAKPAVGIKRTDSYKPVICTFEALDRLSGRSAGSRRQVDVRRELLPLLFAEMTARYYAQMAFKAGAPTDGAAVREQLRVAWDEDRFSQEVAGLGARFGDFDAKALFFGGKPKFQSSKDYDRFVYDALADDLRESEAVDGSPVKSAAEVFAIFRDPMRSVVEYGGMSLDSYLDFNADIRTRITRLTAGPPAQRIRQLLALMDSGVLQAPYGPAPAMGRTDSGPARTRISSTALEQGHAADVDAVIRGHLEDPRIEGSASALLTRLYRRGRVSQFRYGAVAVGSVDLTPDAHPIDIDGHPQRRIWMFGVLTEGIRHFNQYIPSPNRGIRAFDDLGACVAEILS